MILDKFTRDQITRALGKAREGVDYVISAWELEEVLDRPGMNIVSIFHEIENALDHVAALDKGAPTEAEEAPTPS